jgi:molecular chaperone DnaK
MASDNKTLGRFELAGIPQAPRGVPQIEVTFDIDANGILSVTAKERQTGKEQQIKITAKSTLDENEIKRMVNEAESHKEEDQKKRERVQARNELDSLVYQAEKLVTDNKEKVTTAQIAAVESIVGEAKGHLASEDVAGMKSVHDRLQKAVQEFSSELYKAQSAGNAGAGAEQAAAGEGAAGGQPGKGKGDDVIDAEFKDVN